MKLIAKSKKKFIRSNKDKPTKTVYFIGKVSNAKTLNVRVWADAKSKLCSFGPLKKNTLVSVCDAILTDNGVTWYYICYDDKYGFVNSKYITWVNNRTCIAYLYYYNRYIKENHKYFINEHMSDITTFAKAVALVTKKKKVGLTCVVPLRWFLAKAGIKQSNGQSLISAPNGSFKKYYTGDVKKQLTRITRGSGVGKTIVKAVDEKLLLPGDILCYEKLTHTFVYSGQGYKFYEGGGVCAKNDYENGILVDYAKTSYKNRKIAEILRWK